MKVSIIMGSTSDLEVMSPAIKTLEEFGIELDPELNNVRRGDPHFISKEGSRVKVAVIPTDEELEIARISVEIAEKNA